MIWGKTRSLGHHPTQREHGRQEPTYPVVECAKGVDGAAVQVFKAPWRTGEKRRKQCYPQGVDAVAEEQWGEIAAYRNPRMPHTRATATSCVPRFETRERARRALSTPSLCLAWMARNFPKPFPYLVAKDRRFPAAIPTPLSPTSR